MRTAGVYPYLNSYLEFDALYLEPVQKQNMTLSCFCCKK